MSERTRSDLLEGMGYDADEIGKSMAEFEEEMETAAEGAAEAEEPEPEPEVEPEAEEPVAHAEEPEPAGETDSEAGQSPEEGPLEAASGGDEARAEDPPEVSAAEPEPEVDWKARFEESQAQREQERQGFLRRIGALSNRQPQAAPPAPEAGQPPFPPGQRTPDGVVVPEGAWDYDANGNVVLKPEAIDWNAIRAQAPPAPEPAAVAGDPGVEYRLARAENRSTLATEASAAAVASADAAYDRLCKMVVDAQYADGNPHPIADPLEAMRYIESRGLGEQFRQEFPDLAPTRVELLDVLEYGMSADLAAGRRLVKGAAARQAPPAAAPPTPEKPPVAVRQPRATAVGTSTMRGDDYPGDEEAAEENAIGDWDDFFSKGEKEKKKMRDAIHSRVDRLAR